MKFLKQKRFEATLDGFKEFYGVEPTFFVHLKEKIETLEQENKALREENANLKANFDKLVSEVNANSDDLVDQISSLAKEFKVQVNTRYTPRVNQFEEINLDVH